MTRLRFVTLALAAMVTLQQTGRSEEVPALEVRVMSFNIRYGTAADGENHWDRRKELLIETIKAFDPDLLGTQETLGFQRDFLAGRLAGYKAIGVGRDDGREQGEMMALYYKKSRFEELDQGHFWLSETPDEPGSKSWDSSLPRMVTWVKLQARGAGGGAPLVFFNTHFDHRGPTARLESARLLRRKIETLAKDCSVILTGDFNAGEDSAPYRAIFGAVEDRASPMLDSYRAAHPERQKAEGTFSGFKAAAAEGGRIDWIGCSRDWTVVQAGIDRTGQGGRTPSDHFPVTALLRRSRSAGG